MKKIEIQILVEKAKKALKSANILLKESDYEGFDIWCMLCNVFYD